MDVHQFLKFVELKGVGIQAVDHETLLQFLLGDDEKPTDKERSVNIVLRIRMIFLSGLANLIVSISKGGL